MPVTGYLLRMAAIVHDAFPRQFAASAPSSGLMSDALGVRLRIVSISTSTRASFARDRP
jgi:hypothetical protein